MVQDTVTLDADPELFLEKTLDDIYFIDHTLRILLEYLEQNLQLFERDEHLEQLSNLDNQFSRLLQEIISHNGSFSIREIPSLGEKLVSLRNISLERQTSAGNLSSSVENDNTPIVSTEEITELLKAF
jgi:hypothetical protein